MVKILIELPTWLGDCVMLTPAIQAISNFYKDAKLTLIGSQISTEVMKFHPKVTQTLILNKQYGALYKSAKTLGEFDVFFSFRSSLHSKVLKAFVFSKHKYQFSKKKYQNCHQVEKYTNFIADSLKINFNTSKLILHTYNTNNSNNNKQLGINSGASYGSAKRWYPQKFAQVASALSNQYDIVIFGGTNEQDIAQEIEQLLIKKGVNNYKNIAGNTTITELIQQISQLDLLITGDSGPMHIAAAFQVPTVAIFGPTKDKETSPWMNPKSMIVKKHLPCQPCMKRTCSLKHHNCMKLIKATDVLDAVKIIA